MQTQRAIGGNSPLQKKEVTMVLLRDQGEAVFGEGVIT